MCVCAWHALWCVCVYMCATPLTSRCRKDSLARGWSDEMVFGYNPLPTTYDYADYLPTTTTTTTTTTYCHYYCYLP